MSAHEFHDVVIVGAGVAGLYAARILSKLVKNVIVVEAQSRVGGRIRQIEGSAPWPVEVGPEFIHGATSELVQLIDELGFKYQEKAWPDWWYFGREKRLVHDSVGDEDVAKVHELFSNVDLEVSPAPGQPDVSARAWMAKRGANEKMVAIADACYANDFGCSIDQLGLREMIQENRGWDSGETYLLLDRSIQHIPEALARESNVRLSWPVTLIQHTSGGAVLHGPNGSRISCSKVIVTVPHRILQTDRLRFSPPLPAAKHAALQRVQMGNVVKIILSFDRRFWPQDMYDVVCTHCFVPELWMTQYPTTDAACAHLHCITGFLAGERADAASQRPQQVNVDRFLAQLDGMFGGKEGGAKPATASLVKARVFDWSKEEFVGGAYTYPTMGAELGDRDLLAQPLGSTVFFAGEATHPAVNPCIQAALETGRRAALQAVMALHPVPSKL